MAARVCRNCPTIITSSTYKGLCATCARAADRARGTKTERGYGSTVLDTPLGRMTYVQCKAEYQRRMDAGSMYWCADGCGARVDRSDWHLGHEDLDRGRILGPQTSHCNLSAAGSNS